MKTTIFATVNGTSITGQEILIARKRLVNSVDPEQLTFAQQSNEENNSYLNAEALQKLIDMQALVSLAKFEGIELTDDEISQAIYEARSSYEDEIEWETILSDLGLDDKNIREVFYKDMIVDLLIQSRAEHFEDPDNQSIEELYNQNITSMKHQNTYTFIEVEIVDSNLLKLAATILSQNNEDSILEELQKHGITGVINQGIAHRELPEALQEMFQNLEENKVGTLPLDDNAIVLIKLIRKNIGQDIPLEDAREGLTEYLKYQQYQQILDELTEFALEKCDVEYLNADLLKQLK